MHIYQIMLHDCFISTVLQCYSCVNHSVICISWDLYVRHKLKGSKHRTLRDPVCTREEDINSIGDYKLFSILRKSTGCSVTTFSAILDICTWPGLLTSHSHVVLGLDLHSSTTTLQMCYNVDLCPRLTFIQLQAHELRKLSDGKIAVPLFKAYLYFLLFRALRH